MFFGIHKEAIEQMNDVQMLFAKKSMRDLRDREGSGCEGRIMSNQRSQNVKVRRVTSNKRHKNEAKSRFLLGQVCPKKAYRDPF